MGSRISTTRVVVADDHPIVLQGLTALIASDPEFRVVAGCSNGAKCVEAVRDLLPDIAVVDMAMPLMNGLEVLSCVITERLATRVVFLAASLRDSEIVAAAEGGAYGIMLKDAGSDAFLHCLREVAAGRKWLPPDLVQNAAARRRQRSEQAARFDHILTTREQEIMFLAAQGLANKEIAQRLNISEGTIKIHLHHIYRKLPISNRAALVNIARSHRDH
jgi:two-component system, NarL family, nitrate/nitrite response regulator NarL